MRRENRPRHVQEGIGVCRPNPPQTPPIHRSCLDRESLCNQFCSVTIPVFTAGTLTIFLILIGSHSLALKTSQFIGAKASVERGKMENIFTHKCPFRQI